MYEKLAGMTGTAATEAEEFHKIYNLDVVVIPTHKPMIRVDHPDSVYKTARAKFDAIVKDITEAYKKGQPVLVGTTSIEKNEYLSELLRRKGIPHEMLNAKNHEKEAAIISQAGKKGAVTVATNMAGRGVDIILGGTKSERGELTDKEYKKLLSDWNKEHEEVTHLGGLHVIGTERHESRRIDNQLRGRSGRQGDPGSSRFYVGLDDDIMRLFGGDQVARLMTIFKLPEDVPLEHSMVSRAIEQAQVKVEGFHFDTRKHLVEYDDVLNKQREIIYKLRRKVLEGQNLKAMIMDKLNSRINLLVQMHAGEGLDDSEIEKIHTDFVSMIPFDTNTQHALLDNIKEHKSPDSLTLFLTQIIQDLYIQREKQLTEEVMRQVERWVCLSVVDNFWMNHLDSIDDLREGIGLRGYGQKDPLVEYKNEAYNMFESLVSSIDYEITQRIFRVQVQLAPDQMQALQHQHQTTIQKEAQRKGSDLNRHKVLTPAGSQKKLGRNDPCWCGSGKKWKRCHYPQLA